MATPLVVSCKVNAPIAKVWEVLSTPHHIMQWNAAAPEWHCPHAVCDLREGGRFTYRMEARDGSMGFDFCGTFTEVRPFERLAFTLDDDRKVVITLREEHANVTIIEEAFEPENQNPLELQRQGWQAILDNLGRYAASL